ncbi:MAG: hypothetical protein GC205_12175 [Bacteroidetes bacterium]|nr:hypothetical protein [Bacteroidota bacterium]
MHARFARQSLVFSILLAFAASLSSQTVVFTELNYHSDSIRNSADWVEIQNISPNPVTLTGWYLKDGVPENRFNFPNGTVLAAGQFLVISVDIAAFSTVYPTVTNVIGEPNFRFSNSGERLSLFNASNDVVVSFAYTDSLPWQTGSDGHGRTLEIVNSSADPNDPANWFDGCMFGTPGRAYAPCEPPLVLSEINYNSAPGSNPGDWVEWHNRSTTAINLSNFVLKDQRDTNLFVLPPGTSLPAGGYLVLARDLDSFQAVFPDVENAIGSFGFNYSGDGEVIRLFRPDGSIAYSVVYNDGIPWPQPADGFGYTLELVNPNGPMNRYFNWFDGCPLGSPGGPFEPWCWTAGAEEPMLPELQLSVVPGAIRTTLPGTDSGTLLLVDAYGRLLTTLPAGLDQVVLFPATQLPPGIYWVVYQADTGARTSAGVFWPGF